MKSPSHSRYHTKSQLLSHSVSCRTWQLSPSSRDEAARNDRARFRAHCPVSCRCSRPHTEEPGCPPVRLYPSVPHAGFKAILLNETSPLITTLKMKNGTQTSDSVIRTEFPARACIAKLPNGQGGSKEASF